MAIIRPLYVNSNGRPTSAADGDDLKFTNAEFIGAVSLGVASGNAAALDLRTNRIVGLTLQPTQDSEAASKWYVDSTIQGFTIKTPARVATTANIGTYSAGVISAAPNTLDTISLAVGDRILVKNQTATANNGIYAVTTVGTGSNGVWTRAADANTGGASGNIKSGMYVLVNEGSANADTSWVLTTDGVITLDTTGLTFTQFNSLGQVIAGNGISKSGNTLSVAANTAKGIESTSSGVGIVLNGTNPGLAFTSTYVDVKYDSARAITAGASGIGVNLETTNPGLAITTNKLDVKIDTTAATQTLEKVAAGLNVKFSTTSGLAAAAANAGLTVKADTARAITLATNGVGVNLSATTPSLAVTSTALDVKMDPAGGLQPGAAGMGIKIDNVQTLALGVSTANAGLSVTGVPSGFKVNGVATNAGVTAANLDKLTNNSLADGLHFHSSPTNVPTIANQVIAGANYTAGSTGCFGVYLDSSGRFFKGTNTTEVGSNVVGVVTGSVNLTLGSGYSVTLAGLGITGPQTGLTIGQAAYLGPAGELVPYSALASGARIVRMGVIQDTNIIFLNIQDIGTKP